MRGLGRVLVLVAGLGILSYGAAVVAQNSSMSGAEGKDRDAIAKAVQNYMDEWNKHDVHAVAMTYSEDCDFVNNFGTLTHGRDGMEKVFGPFMTGVYAETHQTGTVRTIRFIKPDVAAVDVDWEMTGAKNQDGTARPTRKGIHSLIMTKQPDGKWLITVMHVHEFTATPQLTDRPGQPAGALNKP
jgi:uncharacterized protein (TIGR02246 family)